MCPDLLISGANAITQEVPSWYNSTWEVSESTKHATAVLLAPFPGSPERELYMRG